MNDVANLVDGVIDEPYLAASAAATVYVRALGARILDEIGYWRLAADASDVERMATDIGIHASARGMFEWLLDEVGCGQGLAAGSRPARERRLAAADRQLARHSGIVGSSRQMFDFVAAHYPSILRGERSGAAVLLKGEGLSLLERYFSQSNPLYHVHNLLAGAALESCWRLRPARTVVELGCGTGGTTSVLAATLGRMPGGRKSSLVATDIGRVFLVRLAERLSTARLSTLRVDFTRPLVDQGLPAGTVDYVVATNALHTAPDLAATLAAVATITRRDGALILSESVCPAGERVHQDFVFNLLASAGPGESRFHDRAIWQQALRAAGWRAELAVNSRGRELALLAVARPPL